MRIFPESGPEIVAPTFHTVVMIRPRTLNVQNSLRLAREMPVHW